MIRYARLLPALLVGLVGLAAQGCELPNGEHGKTTLTLSLPEDPILIGDTLVLQPRALDPEGRAVVDPPVEWTFPYLHGRDRGKVDVLNVEGDQALVVGELPGSLRVEIRALPSDPRFTSEVLAREIRIQYAPPTTVSLVSAASDTVLTSRGDFDLLASAVDEDGNVVQAGQVLARTQDRSVMFLEGENRAAHMRAFGLGPDTVVLSHTACSDPCADTIAVDVEPVAVRVGFPDSLYWVSNLRVPFQMVGTVVDRNGYEVPGDPIVWHLADTTGDLSLVDALNGTFVANANGSTEVEARAGSVEGIQRVYVHQYVVDFVVGVPTYVAVGTTVSARILGWDAGGTPVDSLLDIPTSWKMSTWSIAEIVDDPSGLEASVLATAAGETEVTAVLHQCTSDNTCSDFWGTRKIHVIPEPDSVRAYPQSGSTTLNGIGATATWLGDIYLAEPVPPYFPATITGVSLIWTPLDPDIATIDVDGLVTAVSPGTARIVGTMGATADTSVVTVLD